MPAINEVVDLTLEGGIAVITLDNPPVNALSPRLMDGMYDAFVQAIANPEARAILLLCAGRTFIAGADIKALGVESPKVDFFELQAKIEDAGKPVVAAVHGTCLGGGLEVALTCHYRIAAAATRLGLPEVNLGLLPGGGGTQRLPRIIGVAPALHLLLSGEQINAPRALALGLIDAIAPETDLPTAAKAYVETLLAEGRPAKRVRDLSDKIVAIGPEVFEAARAQAQQQRPGEEAPRAIIRCVEAAARGDFDAGIAVERAAFQQLLAGPQSAALRYTFFAERQAAKIADPALQAQPRALGHIGVMGAGPTTGRDIAHALLDAGLSTLLFDTNKSLLADAGRAIASHYDTSVEQGHLSAAVGQRRKEELTLGQALDDFADCDLVIDTTYGKPGTRGTILGELARSAPSALLAIHIVSDTPFSDINTIAAATGRPADVVGLHIQAPVITTRLLEIMGGSATSPETIAGAFALARKLKKVGVLSSVGPDSIGQRMMRVWQTSAEALSHEGNAPKTIDRAAVEFGFALGPFAMLDQMSSGSDASYSAWQDNPPQPPLSDTAILDQLLLPLINEGARILRGGISQRASDIDMVWVHGYGWPAYHGGPMYYADSLGLPVVVEKLRAIGLEPASLLLEYAAAGRALTG